jgi:hypothetical protein
VITIRPATKWFQALAAFLLLAAMPVAEPSRAGRALSQIGDNFGKTLHLNREQPGGLRTEGQPERFDDDGNPDITLAPEFELAPARAFVVHACKIEANEPRFPRFCGASPRAPPSA